MNVKQLIEKLSAYPEGMEIIISKDCEGNDYSPLDDLDPVWYEAHNTWSGECVCDTDVEDPEEPGITSDGYDRVLCLWPVN